ncbi:MAG: hypothetical protein AB2806_18245 [Candidatus Thiodiazotropha sp.]
MVHLKDLESRLISTSSERDLTLFSFLNGRRHSIQVAPNDLESELCYDAFVEGDGDIALSKLRKIKPFKGLHYTNNFVLLIAAAKIDLNGEEDNIISYLSKHGYKEQLIINYALGTDYDIANQINGPIDSLANRIEKGQKINKTDIQQCLSLIDDLYDLFILEKGIIQSIFQENEEKNLPSYILLVDTQRKALKRIELVSFTLLFLAFSYVTYLIVPSIITNVVKHWDTLEPIAYIIDKTVIVILLITGVVVATKVKSIKKKLRDLILAIVYKLLGISYPDYQKLLNTINSQQ